MKLILNGNQEFNVVTVSNLQGSTISFTLEVEDTVPTNISGTVVLKDIITWPETGVIVGDSPQEGVTEDFILFTTEVSEWLRYYVSANTLYFTNIPAVEPYTPTPEEQELNASSRIRSIRDSRLAETDWTQLLDSPISPEARESVRVYRQALRDITEQENFPFDVVWPEIPEIIKGNPDPVDTALEILVGGE